LQVNTVGGAAVSKFPTKYFRIVLCVESLLCKYFTRIVSYLPYI